MGRSPSDLHRLLMPSANTKHLLCAGFRVGAWGLCGSKAEGIPLWGPLSAGGDALLPVPRCQLSHGDAAQRRDGGRVACYGPEEGAKRR